MREGEREKRQKCRERCIVMQKKIPHRWNRAEMENHRQRLSKPREDTVRVKM